MSRDYLMQDVASHEVIEGVKVPLDSDGHYLDHADVSKDGKKARDLTSPYGSLHFAVGKNDSDDDQEDTNEGDFIVCMDYAELPDGRIVLHAVSNSESGGFIEGFHYEVVAREDAVEAALALVDSAMEAVVSVNELTHDREGWNQDEYYFVRSVARTVGVLPYKDMDDNALRFGDRPEVTRV